MSWILWCMFVSSIHEKTGQKDQEFQKASLHYIHIEFKINLGHMRPYLLSCTGKFRSTKAKGNI